MGVLPPGSALAAATSPPSRKICKDAGCDGVIDVWTALNGSSCTKLPPGAQQETPPCPHTPDSIQPCSDTMAVVVQTIAKGIGVMWGRG